MKKILYAHPIIQRVMASVLIVAVFILGRYIPLPFLKLESYLTPHQSNLSWAAHLTGGDLSQIGLFSLGLSPWMYASILMTLFSIGQKGKTISPQSAEYRKNGLMLVIAAIQGLGVAISLDYGTTDKTQQLPLIGMVAVILVAGAFVIAWLIGLNTAYGFAGPSLLVLVSILVGQFRVLPLMADLAADGYLFYLLGIGLWCLMSIYITVVLEKAEYRIAVQRISIKNSLAKEAYMPVKLNLAGGMPFMYAMTLLTFPNYLLALLAYLLPNHSESILSFGRFFSFLTLEGLLVYMVILLVLTLSFAFMNLNPTDKARELRKTGDYIPGIRPGRPTRDYLTRIVWSLGVLNGLFLIVMGGLPLFLILFLPVLQPVVGFPGVVLMTVGIVLSIILEVEMMRLKKRYTGLFQ